jgi:hypothetical protein
MNNQSNQPSGKLKQTLLMIYHNDGIMDIVAGLSLWLLALVMLFDSALFIWMIGPPIVFYIPIKQQVSIPRMGLIQFDSGASTRRKQISILALGSVVFLAGLLVFLLFSPNLGGWREFLYTYEVPIFAVILAGTLFTAGLVMHNRRFPIYAVVALGFVILFHLIQVRIWIAVAVLATAMEVVGIYHLLQFLRTYPKPVA